MTLQDVIYAHELDKLCERVWQMYARTSMDDMLSETSRELVKKSLLESSRILEKAINKLKT